jgi:DNA-binding MarR family transcriptional regulator
MAMARESERLQAAGLPVPLAVTTAEATDTDAMSISTSTGCAERVMDAVPLVMRFMRAHLQEEEGDLPSVAQIRVLSCLTTTPGASLSDVARFINVTKATASSMVARMVEKGYVNRLDDPNERRCVMLTATDTGREIYLRARAHALTAVADVLENVSAQDREKIAAGLELLREAFSK